MLEIWRYRVHSNGRTLTLPVGSDEPAHFPEGKKGLLTDLTFTGRILAVYYRLLAADPERQDELLHDFIRSLTADLDRLEALRRTRPPHTEGTDRG